MNSGKVTGRDKEVGTGDKRGEAGDVSPL